jgi:hypothetical protein
MKERVAALAVEFEAIKKDESALKMRMGKFDDELKKLTEELTGVKDGTINIVQILQGLAAKL